MADRSANMAVFVGGVVLLFLLLLAFIFAGWRAGFFRFTGEEASATVVAAALAAAAAFFGAVLSLIGVLVTRTIEERNHALAAQTEARLTVDSARNLALQQEAETRLTIESERNNTLKEAESERLKLEAGIRAVQLFATSTGAPSPHIQVEGALFTLSSLGYHELTMVLTERLLQNKDLDGNSASVLMDRTLRHGNQAACNDAITILYHQPDRFFMPHYLTLPHMLLEGPDQLPDRVRWYAALALGNMFTARPVAKWKSMVGDLRGLAQILTDFWRAKTASEQERQEMAAILRHALAPFPDLNALYTEEGETNVSEITAKTRSAEPVTSMGREVVAKLQSWHSAIQQP